MVLLSVLPIKIPSRKSLLNFDNKKFINLIYEFLPWKEKNECKLVEHLNHMQKNC